MVGVGGEREHVSEERGKGRRGRGGGAGGARHVTPLTLEDLDCAAHTTRKAAKRHVALVNLGVGTTPQENSPLDLLVLELEVSPEADAALAAPVHLCALKCRLWRVAELL